VIDVVRPAVRVVTHLHDDDVSVARAFITRTTVDGSTLTSQPGGNGSSLPAVVVTAGMRVSRDLPAASEWVIDRVTVRRTTHRSAVADAWAVRGAGGSSTTNRRPIRCTTTRPSSSAPLTMCCVLVEDELTSSTTRARATAAWSARSRRRHRLGTVRRRRRRRQRSGHGDLDELHLERAAVNALLPLAERFRRVDVDFCRAGCKSYFSVETLVLRADQNGHKSSHFFMSSATLIVPRSRTPNTTSSSSIDLPMSVNSTSELGVSALQGSNGQPQACESSA